MLWDMIENEFGNEIKPDTIPNVVFDEWEDKYNDLISEINEWLDEEKSKKIKLNK